MQFIVDLVQRSAGARAFKLQPFMQLVQLLKKLITGEALCGSFIIQGVRLSQNLTWLPATFPPSSYLMHTRGRLLQRAQ
jgi:hypothetical protein